MPTKHELFHHGSGGVQAPARQLGRSRLDAKNQRANGFSFPQFGNNAPRRTIHGNQSSETVNQRISIMWIVVVMLFGAVLLRLFYWQVVHASVLQAEAEDQYTRSTTIVPHRGSISTSDGFTLVNNQTVYRLFAQPKLMKQTPEAVSKLLTPMLTSTDSAEQKQQLQIELTSKLGSGRTWVSLASPLSADIKKAIEGLDIDGLGFEQFEMRAYPEASRAAKILGFVGKDKDGNDQGYFGIEGALNGELKGQSVRQTFMRDASGAKLLFGNTADAQTFDGRSVQLTIRRDVQFVVEEMLEAGVKQYGAVAGEVIVMEPSTGKILAMASYPSYDPARYREFPQESFKNPSVSDTFEPGSIFKVLTVAAGLDAGLISKNTICTDCAGPRKIASYTIKTWNEEYHPNITIQDALAKSDNVAMIFVAEMLGTNRFIDYIKKFGIGEATGIELQEDTSTPLRKDWKPIDLATSSFGQGIATTGMQMVRAVGAIANGGRLMKPMLVNKVIDPSSKSEVVVQPEMTRQVISPAAAAEMTEMMVAAASSGEAKWTSSKTHAIAGKTGTAQIPIGGGYDATKTNASFIGFAPPQNAKFVMLVKLQEPQQSIWAAETAAPLWYKIADRLYLLLNIPPDR